MLYAIQCSVEGGYEELAQRHALPAVLPDRLDGHTGSYNHIVDSLQYYGLQLETDITMFVIILFM